MKHRQKTAKERPRRFFDYSLLFIVIFLVCFGLVMIYSTSSYTAQLEEGNSFYYLKRQAEFALLGFAGALIISRFDYHTWIKFAAPAFIGMTLIQLVIIFIGSSGGGQNRWLEIGPIRFQPSEISKVALILFLAYFASRMTKKLQKIQGVALLLFYVLPMIIFVAVTNLSTALIMFGITFIMLFVASNKYLMFIGTMGAGVVFSAIFVMTAGYRAERIKLWLDIESTSSTSDNYQILQSLYAIGSGGLFGKGLGQSIQKLSYLPEAHNDMIFAVICEELGLFGAVALILLFVLLLWRCMIIANNAPDLFGALLVVGIMAQIALQVLVNIGVATNSIPNTGVTLPFISYGGTSLTFLICEIGLILGVSRQIKLEE